MKNTSKKIILYIGIILTIGLLFIIFKDSSYIFLFIGKIMGFQVQEETYFSMVITILFDNKKIQQDSEILANIKIVKLGFPERIDAGLEIYVQGPDNIILEKSFETFAIDTQVSIAKTIHVPSYAPLGDYKVIGKVIYLDKEEATASTQFQVIEKSSKIFTYVFIGSSITITFLILVFYFLINIYQKVKRNENILYQKQDATPRPLGRGL